MHKNPLKTASIFVFLTSYTTSVHDLFRNVSTKPSQWSTLWHMLYIPVTRGSKLSPDQLIIVTGFLPGKNSFLLIGREELPFFQEETQPWLVVSSNPKLLFLISSVCVCDRNTYYIIWGWTVPIKVKLAHINTSSPSHFSLATFSSFNSEWFFCCNGLQLLVKLCGYHSNHRCFLVFHATEHKSGGWT